MSLIWDTQSDERRQRLEDSQPLVWNWTAICWYSVCLAVSLGLWYGLGQCVAYVWWVYSR